jgi:uncharacterized protein (DUF169 family)
MIQLGVFHEYGDELEKRLRLKTSPISIKLLEKESDTPESAIRPRRDLKRQLFLCQSFAMSRRQGTTVAMLKEDMLCFEPVIGYGIAKAPDYFLKGNNRFPQDVETLEAGSNWAHQFPRLDYGRYIGVVSASLLTSNFAPDVVLIYGNPSQLRLLLAGIAYKDGYDITSTLSCHSACVYSIVPVLLTGKCQVTMPCRGDQKAAVAQDDELIFSVPVGRLEDLIYGIRRVGEAGYKMPNVYPLGEQLELPKSYEILASMLGMR